MVMRVVGILEVGCRASGGFGARMVSVGGGSAVADLKVESVGMRLVVCGKLERTDRVVFIVSKN
jgi:hypothetical protein